MPEIEEELGDIVRMLEGDRWEVLLRRGGAWRFFALFAYRADALKAYKSLTGEGEAALLRGPVRKSPT